MDAKVSKLVETNDFLRVVELDGPQKNVLNIVRVHCTLTKHDMVPKETVILQHLRSKALLKAKNWYNYDFSKYRPYIIPHRRKPKCLYCNVTQTTLNRIPEQVEKHVSGKRYQRMLQSVPKILEETSTVEEFDANAFENKNHKVFESDAESSDVDESFLADKMDGNELSDDDDVDKSLKKKGTDCDDLSDLYPAEDFEPTPHGQETLKDIDPVIEKPCTTKRKQFKQKVKAKRQRISC
uniref:Uncharacterized protein AlNc14C476G11866 n=1 Tax=Albugo laibachii Nc14 TaxID=890382 RepID=F0X0C8_9STRA|nr:conserved hypothetical protein [Albugo laibachii Nc14]|eukprot:CCA27212.1 conserved hypothetical protein [Albugo laibachii Nc14]